MTTMIPNKERQWATAMEKLKTHAARMQRSRLPPGFDELLDHVFELCDSVLPEVAGAQDEFEARIVRLEREVSRHAEAWTLLFDRMPVACIETHPNGIILRANTSAALLLNMSARYLDGRLLTHFSEHRDEFTELLRTLSHGPARHHTSLAIRPRERAPFSAELLLMPSAAATASSWLWFLGEAARPGGLSAARRNSPRPAAMIDLTTGVPHK
jgi:PAS domain-containing protein